MDEFKLSVSLLTPASDLVLGDPGEKFTAVFGRAGNDIIYAYDPYTNNSPTQKIDFLFGDIFDNSQEEFEIILNIQAAQQGGNPLLILDRNIPSVGKDKFVLGDINQPYYTDSSFLGLDKFAVIYDFDPTQDTIRLNGKPEDYRLVDVNGLKVQGIDQLFYGKAIFSVQKGTPDLIGYIIERPEVKLDLKGKYFEYAGEKPPKKPEQKKIGQLGTTGIDLGLAAATDRSGNVYITGSTTGPLQGTNQGFTDAWIAKLDSNGNQLWGKQIGSSASETAYAVVTDKSGNVYVAGDTGGNLFGTKQSESQDAWIAKYNSNGNLQWAKQLGTNVTGGYANTAFGLQVDDNGGVYLSGLAIKDNQRTDIFNFPVQDDSWVTKFDSSGKQQWFTQIGSFFFDENYDLAVDKNGNSYLTGWTQGLVKESDPSRQLLKYDAWLAKVNPKGDIDWVRQFGSKNEGLEFAWGVDTDSKGNIYVTGWTTGDIGVKDKTSQKSASYDIWLSKFTPDGTQQWTKQFGSPGDDGQYLSDMEIDSQDNIFLIGYTNDKLGKGTKDEAYNAWVARFDTEGNNKWIQQFGSKNRLDYPTGISADDAGKLYVTGFTDGLLGSSNTGANGAGVDAWVAQLDVKKGNVQKFIGNSKDFISIKDPDSIATVDISNNFVTDERLPNGDNRINPAEGIGTTKSTLDYGDFVSALGGIFDPNARNSFPSALAAAVNSGQIDI